MRIYPGMNREKRNEILEQRCRDYGIAADYDSAGNAAYIPDAEDRILFYENCENPELKQEIGNALTAVMGTYDGDDSWTEIC